MKADASSSISNKITLKYIYSFDNYDILTVERTSNAIYSVFFKNGAQYLLASGASCICK